MASKNGIEYTMRYQWYWNISGTWSVSPLAVHCTIGPSVIASMYYTQMPYYSVTGGHHITSSGVTKASAVVGFPAWSCSGMVSEVLFVIYLSHLPHPEYYSTC